MRACCTGTTCCTVMMLLLLQLRNLLLLKLLLLLLMLPPASFSTTCGRGANKCPGLCFHNRLPHQKLTADVGHQHPHCQFPRQPIIYYLERVGDCAEPRVTDWEGGIYVALSLLHRAISILLINLMIFFENKSVINWYDILNLVHNCYLFKRYY